MTETTTPDPAAVTELCSAVAALERALARRIVGQQEPLRLLMIALLSRGHCLLEGVPGLAKTLIISSLAEAVAVAFNRIQFTPDLMPSDVTGTEVLHEDRESARRELRFIPGPIFANVVLADEINRTPPKTQAALLEAMQERQVSVGGERHVLPAPFFVLATQNPLDQEGTYPLPEAQMDRFMFKLRIGYPSYDEEYLIAERTTGSGMDSIESVIDGEAVLRFQELTRQIPLPKACIDYALRLVRATRIDQDEAHPFARQHLAWGAGPRAVQNLLLGAKTGAALDGRCAATVDDVRQVAHPVLRHRLAANYLAQSEGIDSDAVIDRLLAEIPAVADTREPALGA